MATSTMHIRKQNFWISCICLFIFCIPRNYDAFANICRILRVVELPGVVWALVLFYRNRYDKIEWFRPFWILLLVMFICMLVNDPENMKDFILLVYRMFSVTVLAEHMFRLDKVEAIKWIGRIWTLLLLIEAYSLYTHCFGFSSSSLTKNYNYFFGIRVEINEYVIYSFAFVCLAACIGKIKDKIMAIIAIACGLYFVMDQKVSTSIVGCSIFILILIIGRCIKSDRIWKNLIILIMLVSVTFIFIQDVVSLEWLLVDILGESITLNNRTILWKQAIEQMKGEHLLFGYGYGPEANLRINSGYVVNHPHNNYLQMLYNYGVMGLLLYLIMFFNMIKNIVKVKSYRIRIVGIAALTATIIMCITSRNYLYLTAQIFYVVILHIDELDNTGMVLNNFPTKIIGRTR